MSKTWLNPPPALVQPTSPAPGLAWQLPGLPVLSTVRPPVALGSVHRYVPPTPVTSGSDAGHSTDGYGRVVPPDFTGVFSEPAVPLSPEEPITVTPLRAADLKACRRGSIDWGLPNAPSAEAEDCEMTFARWWSTTLGEFVRTA
ncbi:hypothetical protein ACIRYZ_07400 [Kitasatospora sp. NPDC101155]|uniref:hypothetical protein n=1 Tax=Kitasatospora sp. NPDC101155 TaxID=3364097 RepID=UPI0037FA21AB